MLYIEIVTVSNRLTVLYIEIVTVSNSGVLRLLWSNTRSLCLSTDRVLIEYIYMFNKVISLQVRVSHSDKK